MTGSIGPTGDLGPIGPTGATGTFGIPAAGYQRRVTVSCDWEDLPDAPTRVISSAPGTEWEVFELDSETVQLAVFLPAGTFSPNATMFVKHTTGTGIPIVGIVVDPTAPDLASPEGAYMDFFWVTADVDPEAGHHLFEFIEMYPTTRVTAPNGG